MIAALFYSAFFCFVLFRQPILGKLVQRPAKMDKKLVRELKNLADPTMDPYDTVSGKTMCADDFYEGINPVWCAIVEQTDLFWQFDIYTSTSSNNKNCNK